MKNERRIQPNIPSLGQTRNDAAFMDDIGNLSSGNSAVHVRSWRNQQRGICNRYAIEVDAQRKHSRQQVYWWFDAGKEAKLSYSGNVLMENRNGLVVDVEVMQANGTAEREAAVVMVADIEGKHPVTVGGDKGCDTIAVMPSAITKWTGTAALMSRMLRSMPFQCRTFLGQP
jgi:hypothetical protein